MLTNRPRLATRWALSAALAIAAATVFTGCGDNARTGAGTGGYGAGPAEDSNGVRPALGGLPDKTSSGTTTAPGASAGGTTPSR